MMSNPLPELYIGVMSGTSMDAVDVALVSVAGHKFELIEYQQTPIPKKIQQAVRSICIDSRLGEISELDAVLGNLFADAVRQILKTTGSSPENIRAIGSHGQTILHLPHATHPRTLQIGDPNIIAVQTGIPTVADFRRMDIAAGGEGAPLAPAFHRWRFQRAGLKRVILNIGGMANITILPADERSAITGFDTGPGNALLDEWTQLHLSKDFDKDGDWASSGHCNQVLLTTLLDENYFNAAPPKSTGKDFFNLEWLNDKLPKASTSLAPNDIQATLLELSIITISDAITCYADDTDEILVCGGGVHNKAMMAGLSSRLAARVYSTDKAGIDPDAVEAAAFAWLAERRMTNKPGNLTSVTGARSQVILGGVYSR